MPSRSSQGHHGVLLRHTLQLGEVAQLVNDDLLGVEAPLLGQIADLDFLVVDGLSVDQHLTGVGLEDIHQNADGGGLARAVPAQQTEGLPALRGEGDPLEDLLVPEGFVDVFQF